MANDANELLSVDPDGGGSGAPLPLVYDKNGNLREQRTSNIGANGYRKYVYTYDAWNRLTKVEFVLKLDGQSPQNPIAILAAQYNGLNWRTVKDADTSVPINGLDNCSPGADFSAIMIRIHSLQPPTAKESELEFVPVDPAYGNLPQCPACHDVVAMKTWLPPHTATLEFTAGTCRLASPMAYPHIYIMPGNYAVVSSTFFDHYKHLNMRGITSFAPIRIEQIQHLSEVFSGPLPTFFHVSIERLNYALDLATSKLSTKAVAACPRCLGATYRPANRLTLQRGSWQGQAIFHVDAVPGRTFITDEFCVLLKQLQGWNYRIARTDILTV